MLEEHLGAPIGPLKPLKGFPFVGVKIHFDFLAPLIECLIIPFSAETVCKLHGLITTGLQGVERKRQVKRQSTLLSKLPEVSEALWPGTKLGRYAAGDFLQLFTEFAAASFFNGGLVTTSFSRTRHSSSGLPVKVGIGTPTTIQGAVTLVDLKIGFRTKKGFSQTGKRQKHTGSVIGLQVRLPYRSE